VHSFGNLSMEDLRSIAEAFQWAWQNHPGFTVIFVLCCVGWFYEGMTRR
jgi:hypothetical protein